MMKRVAIPIVSNDLNVITAALYPPSTSTRSSPHRARTNVHGAQHTTIRPFYRPVRNDQAPGGIAENQNHRPKQLVIYSPQVFLNYRFLTCFTAI